MRKKVFTLLLQIIRLQHRESVKPVSLPRKEKRRTETEDLNLPAIKRFNASVRDAGRYVLIHLMNLCRNLPPVPGIEFGSSTICESDDNGLDERAAYFFSFNDVLISIVEVPNPTPHSKNLNMARLILRDVTGKYVWDFENFQSSPDEKSEIQYVQNLIQPNKVQTPSPQPLNLKPYPAREKGAIALYDFSVDGSKVDKMKELLQ